MAEPSFRAIAILRAKDGLERQLLDFTLASLPLIRTVEGLGKVELSRSLEEPGRLMLYYWWESPEHSRRYVSGPVYTKIAPQLEALVGEHLLVLGERVDHAA